MIVAAVLYVAYNVAVVPAVLFCLHRQTRRSETGSRAISTTCRVDGGLLRGS